jgi:hypothetical protein
MPAARGDKGERGFTDSSLPRIESDLGGRNAGEIVIGEDEVASGDEGEGALKDKLDVAGFSPNPGDANGEGVYICAPPGECGEYDLINGLGGDERIVF